MRCGVVQGRLTVYSRPVQQGQGRQFTDGKEESAEAHRRDTERAEIRREGPFALLRVKKSMVHNL